ncbi:interleukin-33 [Acomys russatus]|uniref:interleukin-33 n=1 Tax=Acomys russatus TaxID=60746 RepID=UPI0021E20B4D|nr:interleukin-33 [Acomys russatus]
MKPKMKYSKSKISPAKLNSTTDKSPAQPCKLRRSPQKAKEICHVYYMRLRSGLTIRKESCYFVKEPAKRYPLKSRRKHEENFSSYSQDAVTRSLFEARSLQALAAAPSIRESCASLSTYNDQSVNFVLENGCYVINVEDSAKDQEQDKVLLRYYESSSPASEAGSDDVDSNMPMVNMSPIKDTDIWLHANDKDHSVELQRCQVPLPDQAFFVLHRKSSDYVSFESMSHRGAFIGVKDNQLALIEKNDMSSFFKLSKV